MKIGMLTVTSLIDGELGGALDYYYPDADVSKFEGFERSLDRGTGNLILSIGGYLIRGGDRVILVDAGVGPLPKTPPVVGGTLRSSLLAHDVSPEDVTDVVFTHLHFDHIGWATVAGAPFFPNATYHCDRRDWNHFMDPAHDETDWLQRFAYPDTDLPRIRLAPIADRMQFWEGDAEIAPGIRAIDASGHTPGTDALLIESHGARGLLLGDVVHSQAELIHGWRFKSHVDPDAAVNRVLEFRDFLADEGIACSASHFPGLTWGRVIRNGEFFTWQDID